MCYNFKWGVFLQIKIKLFYLAFIFILCLYPFLLKWKKWFLFCWGGVFFSFFNFNFNVVVKCPIMKFVLLFGQKDKLDLSFTYPLVLWSFANLPWSWQTQVSTILALEWYSTLTNWIIIISSKINFLLLIWKLLWNKPNLRLLTNLVFRFGIIIILKPKYYHFSY